MWISPMFRDFQAISGSIRIIFRKGEKCFSTQTQKRNDEARKEVAMARLTERAFENAVVRLRDGQGALGQSALDVLHEQREELANQMLARLAGSDEFAAMLERNFAPYRRLMTYYECAMMEVETKFRVLDAEFGLQHDRNPIESIKSRLKSTDSLAKKLVRKGFPMSVDSIEENIYDVAGVRVVCTFPEDMFSLAESLLSQDDVQLIERRDYVASPKPSGYRSLHLIIEVPIFLEHEKRSVKVEVKLRTISMNFWASLEHQLRYKKELPEEETAAVAAELADLAETAADLDRRMQALRNYLDDGEE